MDITHCKEFLVLAARLNFTEAAAELNMTQPALSKHVSALEKEFGARLLDRNPRNLQLTEAGRIFVENAADIVDRYERTKHLIATMRERTLLVGGHFGDTDISSFISMATLIAREDFDTYVTICGKTAESYIERLQSGEIDLFVGYIDPDEARQAGLTVHTFFKDPLNAVMDSRHRLAHHTSITLDDLRNETLLHCGSGEIDRAWERIIAEIRQRGVNPRMRFVPCDNPVAVFTTPLSGGVLLWKRTFREIGQLVATGSRASVPLSDDICLTSYLAYLPETEQRLQGFSAPWRKLASCWATAATRKRTTYEKRDRTPRSNAHRRRARTVRRRRRNVRFSTRHAHAPTHHPARMIFAISPGHKHSATR